MLGPSAPPDLLEHMRRALGGAGPFDRQSSDRAPSAGGSYVLLVHLSRPLEFERPGLRHRFEPGWYGYVGSARGPGGIRARIGRHLRAEKAVHWHIDSLTITADIVLAFVVEGASKCTLNRSLLRSRVWQPSAAGFGSSDCRNCATHLLEPVDMAAIDRGN